MAQESKSLEQLFKPLEDMIRLKDKEISRLCSEIHMWKCKYELLKRGIPSNEIDEMYRKALEGVYGNNKETD